jgi:hypothetical protein
LADGTTLEQENAGSDWISFAGIMVMIAGILNNIWGIAAVGRSQFFTGRGGYIAGSWRRGGWIVWIIGIIEIAQPPRAVYARFMSPPEPMLSCSAYRGRGGETKAGTKAGYDCSTPIPVTAPAPLLCSATGSAAGVEAVLNRLERALPDSAGAR